VRSPRHSWSRDYLVARGANPVFYIARQSLAAVHPPASRQDYFDAMEERWGQDAGMAHRETYDSLEQMRASVPPEGGSLSQSDAIRAFAFSHQTQELHDWQWFMEHNIFCFMKFFDSSLPADHRINYYMEREWRIIGNVPFEHEALRRVIVPRAFVGRLLQDFPHLTGQVTVAEDCRA